MKAQLWCFSLPFSLESSPPFYSSSHSRPPSSSSTDSPSHRSPIKLSFVGQRLGRRRRGALSKREGFTLQLVLFFFYSSNVTIDSHGSRDLTLVTHTCCRRTHNSVLGYCGGAALTRWLGNQKESFLVSWLNGGWRKTDAEWGPVSQLYTFEAHLRKASAARLCECDRSIEYTRTAAEEEDGGWMAWPVDMYRCCCWLPEDEDSHVHFSTG